MNKILSILTLLVLWAGIIYNISTLFTLYTGLKTDENITHVINTVVGESPTTVLDLVKLMFIFFSFVGTYLTIAGLMLANGFVLGYYTFAIYQHQFNGKKCE